MASQDDCSASVARGGYVDPSWPRPDTSDSACIIIYGYVPSIILCGLALGLFAIALVLHAGLFVQYRTWYFLPVTIGLVMEIVGYIARTLSSQKNPYSVTYFVIQYFFIVVAPVMLSAAIYAVITVAINRIGRQFALIKAELIWKIFVACDVVATIVQVAGAALVGTAYSNGNDPNTANNILLAGLVFQVVSLFLFVVVFVSFIYRSRRHTNGQFKQFAAATFVATLAVYLRTIFRLAETAQGLLENLSTHEAYFGALEFLPIVVAIYIFVYWHPGKWLGCPRVPQGKACEYDGLKKSRSKRKPQGGQVELVGQPASKA